MNFPLNCDTLIEIVKKIDEPTKSARLRRNFEQIVRLVTSINKSIFKECLIDRRLNDYLITFIN